MIGQIPNLEVKPFLESCSGHLLHLVFQWHWLIGSVALADWLSGFQSLGLPIPEPHSILGSMIGKTGGDFGAKEAS